MCDTHIVCKEESQQLVNGPTFVHLWQVLYVSGIYFHVE